MFKLIAFSFFLFAPLNAANAAGDYTPAFRSPAAAVHAGGLSFQKSIQRDFRRVYSLFVKPDIKLAKNDKKQSDKPALN